MTLETTNKKVSLGSRFALYSLLIGPRRKRLGRSLRSLYTRFARNSHTHPSDKGKTTLEEL